MKRREAIKIDNSMYIDFDEEFEIWGIFGDNSGFCYASYSSKEEAEERLQHYHGRISAIMEGFNSMREIFRDADEELNKLFEEIIQLELDEDKEIQWPENFLIFSNVNDCDPIMLIEKAVVLGLQTGIQTVYRLYAGETYGYAVVASHKHLREILKDLSK